MTLTRVPSWYSSFSAILDNFGAVPAAGLCPPGVPAALNMTETLHAFDTWSFGAWSDLPARPPTAEPGILCKYC